MEIPLKQNSIYINMEVKIKEYSNIMNLEFGLLRELPKLRVLDSLKNDEDKENIVFKNLKSNLKKFVFISEVFEVIEKIDDGFICLNEEDNNAFYFIKNCLGMEVGEIYCRNYSIICKVNQELIDDETFKGLFVEIDKWVGGKEEDYWRKNDRRYSRNGLIGIEEIKEDGITSEMIKNLLIKHKKTIEKGEEEEKKEKEEREKVKKIKESDEEKIYNTESIGTFSNFSISKKIIKGIWDEMFVLEKNVNEIFSHERVKKIDGYDGYTILSNVEIFLYENKITYTKMKNGDEKYKVVYINDKCKVGGINIPFSKQKFILNRLSSGSDKKEIKILLKLNGMKADFVSLENLIWRDGSLEIPIKNKAIDDKTFKVDFLGKIKTFNWGEVKKMFFNRGRGVNSRVGNEELLSFCCEVGVSKKDLFGTLRRLKMLKELEESDGN